MQITLDIPDDIAASLIATGEDPARAVLEAIALQGYRDERLSEHDLRLLLGFETRAQVHTLLAEHNICLQYTIEHLQQDISASNKLYSKRTEVSDAK